MFNTLLNRQALSLRKGWGRSELCLGCGNSLPSAVGGGGRETVKPPLKNLT